MRSTKIWLACFALSSLIACGGDDDAMSTDATVPERDSSTVCRAHDECDDGLYCNGPERCMPLGAGADASGCVPGALPCPGATCIEDGRECVDACSNPDADRDGFDAMACGGSDCDDGNPAIYPGAPEICDPFGVDEDCNPSTYGERDVDGDGSTDARCCNGGACGSDCDDLRASVRPLAAEVCDGLDNDCDGSVDEGVTISAFADEDRDLYGDPDAPISGCPGWPGVSTAALDCDDGDPRVHGASIETGDGIDNDCDGHVDEDVVARAWYVDADDDGFGAYDFDRAVVSITPVDGYSVLPSDCDDTDPARNPRRVELCNALDDDCNAATAFVLGVNDTEDDDGDGFPDARCEGIAPSIADCDDRDPTIRPGAFERCDGRDEDCDGAVDEDCGELPDGGVDAGLDAGVDAGFDAGPPRCPPEGCAPPFPSDGSDGDLILTGVTELVLEPGTYHYERIEIGPSAVLRTRGTGVLELRARGPIVVRGTIDVAGGAGGHGAETGCSSGTIPGGGGGHTGRAGASAVVSGCAPGGEGGLGEEGARGVGACGNGGLYGGGAGGHNRGVAGGGGGGYGGGGGGESEAGGAGPGGSGGRELAGTMGSNGGADAMPAQGGRTTVPGYDGGDGGARGCGYGGGGGGGSIGESAARDLAVATTFRPGSGGGGGGSGYYASSGGRCGAGAGGGGGGGALRLASHESITIFNTARISVAGGRGGNGSGVSTVVSSGSGAGGGGSGGVLYIAAPVVRADSGATLDARGGAGGGTPRACGTSVVGGAGGLGRIRFSVEPTTCMVGATTYPPMPAGGCVPSAMPGEVYVGAYPY